MLQGILLAVIVILLLVVLIPVGIALFQRLRPERAAAPPREKAAPPPPIQNLPTAKMKPLVIGDVPTDKVNRPPAAPPAPPPPDLTPSAAPPVPPSDRTRIPETA